MKKLYVWLSTALMMMGVISIGLCGATGLPTETITISVNTKGSPADATRGTNIVEAAKELDKMLESRKDPRRVVVEVNHDSTGTSDNDTNKKFFLAWQSGNAVDIMAIGHGNIALYASGGYALQLDNLIKKSQFKRELYKIYENLWDSAKFAGKIYGIPQDAECRPLYFRRDILKKMGWTEKQLSDLPEKVKNGQFTLDDLLTLARTAKEKGFVKWGFFHRPTNGPDFAMMVMDYGGRVYDPKEEKIVLDKKPTLEALSFFRRLTQEGITPDGMTSIEWRSLHQQWVEGDVLFWLGGTWHWAEYQQVAYHSKYGKLTEEYMTENMGYCLVPAARKAGRPITLTNPFVYLINSKTKYPDLAFSLIAIASKPQYNANHAINSGHLVISPDAAKQPRYRDNDFFNSVSYMLNYTTIEPNTPVWNRYLDALYKVVQAVELGKQSPDEAMIWLEAQLKNDLGDKLIIIQ